MYASELGNRLINTLQNLSKYYSVPNSNKNIISIIHVKNPLYPIIPNRSKNNRKGIKKIQNPILL